MKTTTLTLALALLATPAFAAPGHSGGHGNNHGHYDGHAAALGEPGDPKAKARTINIVMSDEMRFSPETVTVKRGETIRFVVKNAGELRHEMTLGTMEELVEHAAVMEKHPDMEHDDPNAVTVEPGQTKTILWKFTKAGSFDFGCLVPGHMPAGMKGRIVVR
jgi:uncharacterized cupredoxin-like copper-binding protein